MEGRKEIRGPPKQLLMRKWNEHAWLQKKPHGLLSQFSSIKIQGEINSLGALFSLKQERLFFFFFFFFGEGLKPDGENSAETCS